MNERAGNVDEFVDDSELTLFYQLLHVAPQIGALLYRPELNEAFRCWLQDVLDGADVQTRRWLTVLYMYYGLYDGEPSTYRDVAEKLERSEATVREQAARGLRFLWDHTNRIYEDPESGLREALAVNEWPTADVSQEVSLDFFLVLLDEAGEIQASGLTPTVPSPEDFPNRAAINAASSREPNLWNPEWAEKVFGPMEERRITG